MRKITAVTVLSGLAGLAGVAQADSITQAQLTDGSQMVAGLLADGSATAQAFANYDSTTGVFSHFSVFGLERAAGVRSIDPLINGPEAIQFDFAKPVAVDQLDVVYLYDGLIRDETATFQVTFADSTTGSFTLSPTSLNSATYSGPATDVQSDDLGVFGEWQIANPFGEGRAITQLVLKAGSWSDYGFEQMSVTPVPLPLAAWGGLSLLGALGAVRARKRMLSA